MEQYGSQGTFNVESVLQKNIVGCEYYNKTCVKLDTWAQVVDEIYDTVSDVEPWLGGNARGASTAFCLLYRLFVLKITEEEVKGLLSHTDSPYIRAIGFLYLRYVGPPKMLWDFLAPYVNDSEEFTPSPEGFGHAVSMGDFVRDIFLEQYYFETIFPRIPKPVHDDFVSKLTAMGLPSRAQRNGGQGGGDRRGVKEGNRRPASVKASLSVAFGQRAPNRATAREEGRGLGAGMRGASGQQTNDERDRQADREKERRHERDNYRDRNRDRDRERERDRDRRERDRLHDIGRDRDRQRERERDRDRERGRERDRDRDGRRDFERDRRGDRDREYRREPDRHRERNGHREEERGAQKRSYREEEDDRERKRSKERR